MFRHADIWRALDALAAHHGLSPSGLARLSGLDPTAFNVSKRINRHGKPRWPGTESVAKVLRATGCTLHEFGALVSGEGGQAMRRIPVIGFARAGRDGFFDDAGFPVGGGWDAIDFPDLGDAHAYALEITGDSMEPVYRAGDIVVVSPAAAVRRGDRVVVRTRAGEVMAKELVRRTARRIELRSVNAGHADPVLSPLDVAWTARIVWASQ